MLYCVRSEFLVYVTDFVERYERHLLHLLYNSNFPLSGPAKDLFPCRTSS